MNNFTTYANGILIDDKIRCQFCGNKMERRHSMMGAGIVNNYDYWCNCGAVAIFSHRFDKPIKTVTIKYEYE